MKRIASFMVALIMATSFSIPAFAEEEKRYVPIVPEFLEVGGDSVNIKAPLDYDSTPEIQQFYANLHNRPGLVLLRQETSNEYYKDSSGEYVNIGDDRKWSIIVVVPSASANFTYYIQYQDPLVYSDTRSMPMRIFTNGNALSTVTYYYDYKTKRFSTGVYDNSIGYFNFSYVLGCEDRANAVSTYPYFKTIMATKLTGDKLETANLDVGKSIPDGIDRHYDWWLGGKSVTNIEEPIEPDPGSSSSEPGSSSSEPDSSSSEPSSSSSTPWEPDPKPDNSFHPFDPSDPDYDPYTPPDDGGDPWNDYDPTSSLPDVPSMPGLPDPPDMDDSDNPFNPPDMDDSDNPFNPPDMDDSDNPFNPSDMDDSDNPFNPPDMDDSDNPFNPPNMDGSSNPFTVPSLDNSDNPFKEPELDSSKSNPFSLESIFNLFKGWFS